MKKLFKKSLTIILVICAIGQSFAAVVSDNDGSAFISKAEFDSLKNTFQSQLDQYNTSIDSKIDNAISSYLAGVKVQKIENRKILFSGLQHVSSLDLDSDELKWKDSSPAGMWLVDVIGFQSGNVTIWGDDFDDEFTRLGNSQGHDYWLQLKFEPQGWAGKGGIISKLDKTKNTATWEGFSDNITGWLINTNTYARDALAIAPNELPTIDAQWDQANTNWYTISGANIENNLVLRTKTNAQGSDMQRDHYLRSYSEKYESMKHINAIIWTKYSQSNFVPNDEILGFGNNNPYKDGTKPRINFTDTMLYSGYFSIRQQQPNASDPSKPIEARHSGERIKHYVFPSDPMYSNSLIFPGYKFADSYITNYNQLKNKNITNPSDGLAMFLYQGLPLCIANAEEQIEWPVQFSDSETYEVVASFKPFDDNMDNDTDWINISTDKLNWSKRAVINNGTGKIYFDFINHGAARKNSVIYVKWHKSGASSSYNGGGIIDFVSFNEVIVTRQ